MWYAKSQLIGHHSASSAEKEREFLYFVTVKQTNGTVGTKPFNSSDVFSMYIFTSYKKKLCRGPKVSNNRISMFNVKPTRFHSYKAAQVKKKWLFSLATRNVKELVEKYPGKF